MLQLRVLGSGSKGNSLFLRSGDTRILIDVGLGIRKLTAIFEEIGEPLECISAIFVTHEHTDHTRALNRFLNRVKTSVFASAGTLSRLRSKFPNGQKEIAMDGTFVEIGPFQVRALPVEHDAADPSGFEIVVGSERIVVATDLGEVSAPLAAALQESTCVLIECNHDEDLLEAGPYPQMLKDRIRSSLGHLSNSQTAAALAECRSNGLRHVILAHLSEHNNDPLLARDTVEQALAGTDVQVHLTAQRVPGPFLNLSSNQQIADKQEIEP